MEIEDISEEGKVRLNEFVGTPLYASPEMVNRSSNYGYNTDMWSLGMILFEMLFGYCIFKEIRRTRELKVA